MIPVENGPSSEEEEDPTRVTGPSKPPVVGGETPEDDGPGPVENGKTPKPKVKTAKVKYVFDKNGRALPVWFVPYTIKSGPDKGKN